MGRRKHKDNEKLAREGFLKKVQNGGTEGDWTPPDPVGFIFSDRDPHRITELDDSFPILRCRSIFALDMQEQIQISPKQGFIVDTIDTNYISGLSTILVATIQEAKDRISQIEYIFCSQIYPTFQSNSKSLQTIYSEARKVAEDAWRDKEKEMLFEMNQIQLQKQQAVEENKTLRFDKAKLLQEQEEKTGQLLVKLESQRCKINELKQEIEFKSKEVEGGKEMQKGLIQLAQSKACEIKKKCDQLEEHEEKSKTVIAELNSHKKKVDELQQQLGAKAEEVAREKELTENLFKKIEKLSLDISHHERLLADEIKEEKFLLTKFEVSEENASRLQEELTKKTKEVEEGRKLQEQLLQQINFKSSETTNDKQEFEKEKQLLLDKVRGLEEKVNELKTNFCERSGEGAWGMDFNDKLLQQIEQKTAEFMAEKKKRRDVVDAYKRLKSQYNYICAKFGLTTDKMIPEHKVEEQSDSSMHCRNPIPFPDLEDKHSDVSAADCEIYKVKKEVSLSDDLNNEKKAKSVQTSRFRSPPSGFIVTEKFPSNVKSAPVAGTKRPASSWRETRSRQCQGGLDPHDDFLDTPFENIRGNLNKAMKEDFHDRPDPAANDMNLDSSDDETQDMNIDPGRQRQQNPVPTAGKQGFKYVEPVRKKVERENLKGVECKQCTKFYDAVLPSDGGKGSDGSKKTLRCEHHEGVSRHRYKYIPPLTPEGFWNIGFESEM